MKKYLFLPFFFLLGACSKSSPEWVFRSASTQPHLATLSSLTTTSSGQCGLEFTSTPSGMKGYLIVKQGRLSLEVTDTTPLFLLQESKAAYFYGHCLKGGQKILLPDEMTETILALLQQEKSLTIRVKNLQLSLSHKGFNKPCERFIATHEKKHIKVDYN